MDDRCGPLDVLHGLPACDGNRGYELLNQRAVVVAVSGIEVRVAALADIVDSKAYAGRPKDRDALEELRVLLRQQSAAPDDES